MCLRRGGRCCRRDRRCRGAWRLRASGWTPDVFDGKWRSAAPEVQEPARRLGAVPPAITLVVARPAYAPSRAGRRDAGRAASRSSARRLNGRPRGLTGLAGQVARSRRAHLASGRSGCQDRPSPGAGPAERPTRFTSGPRGTETPVRARCCEPIAYDVPVTGRPSRHHEADMAPAGRLPRPRPADLLPGHRRGGRGRQGRVRRVPRPGGMPRTRPRVREKEGVWGGATERERRRIIRQRRRAS